MSGTDLTPVEMDTLYRQRIALGTITPSSNTVVEALSQAILADYPEISAHFARTPVVGDRDPLPDRYDLDSMLGAATLLGHARLLGICWNGSKGATIGLDQDRDLCRRINESTGIQATTAMLVLDRWLQARDIQRVAVVTPYATAYQQRTLDALQAAGYHCVAGAHAGLSDNFAFSRVAPETIQELVMTVASSNAQAILTLCTNFPAAPVAANLSRQLGLPVLDSVAAGVRGLLDLAEMDCARSQTWGPLFEAL